MTCSECASSCAPCRLFNRPPSSADSQGIEKAFGQHFRSVQLPSEVSHFSDLTYNTACQEAKVNTLCTLCCMPRCCLSLSGLKAHISSVSFHVQRPGHDQVESCYPQSTSRRCSAAAVSLWQCSISPCHNQSGSQWAALGRLLPVSSCF